MKIGRNEPCPCGSGKKYKKCCMDIDQIKRDGLPKEIIDYFNKVNEEKARIANMGILINYVNPILFKGKRVWALGNKVYHSRPPEETFHQFIIDILRITLGKEWWIEQSAKKDKHFIMQCYFHHAEWIEKNKVISENRVSNHVWGAKPDGWSKALLLLAFDVCSLVHTSNLPNNLLNRLKNTNEYQGARYEIAIAAIFARLNFKIYFLDLKEKSKKHCEFFAKQNDTSIEVAVEVKSRHRKGVLHEKGDLDEEEILRGDVERLIGKALKQNPGDKPFFIFIDLNSPITPNIKMQEKPWFKDIRKIMDKKYGTPSATNPENFNGLFFTNFSYHYQTKDEALRGEHLSIIPIYTIKKFPDMNIINMIDSAFVHYGNVPNIDIK